MLEKESKSWKNGHRSVGVTNYQIEKLYDPVNIMKRYLKKISNLNSMALENSNFGSNGLQDMWDFVNNNMLYEDKYRHLPIPIFSYIKPTMGAC